MCVFRSFTLNEEEEEWLAYDPNTTLPQYTSFDNLPDAKKFCEVTVTLCGS